MAGDVLLEIGLNRVQGSALGHALPERVRRRLADLLRGGHLGRVERVTAGNTLARLGDPRFRADAWYLPDEPLLGFVEIPAGPFLMGRDRTSDPTASAEEVPQHPVSLLRYFIARYPVTVAQFRAFVEASGYRPKDEDSLRGPSNHPVVNVSWYEARRYCAWLTERLRAWEGTPEPLAMWLRREDWSVTLPSEAEWEKAARGPDGRLYPWGDEPDPNRANYDETRIGTTSAVGCFPAGASLYGVEDLAGNVWEWTRDPSKVFLHDEDSERLEMVHRARGGSFSAFAPQVRCAFSGSPIPHWEVGFRVVVRPSS